MAVGGAKGDGSADILKDYPQRFRWSPYLRCWVIRNSRDKLADHRRIECTATALRAAGFVVSVTIDEDTRRTFAEAKADRYERAEARAERRQDYADAAAERSAALYTAGREKLSRIPFGQPILSDHYLANRDRNYRARAAAQIDRSFAEADKHAHQLPTPAGTRRAVKPGLGRRRPPDVVLRRAGAGRPGAAGELLRALTRRPRHVPVSIMDYARYVLPVARRLGVPISTDLHAWDSIAEHHKDFAHTAGVVFLSAAALGDRRDRVIGGIVRAGRAEVVVATDGAARIWDIRGGSSTSRRCRRRVRWSTATGPATRSSPASSPVAWPADWRLV